MNNVASSRFEAWKTTENLAEIKTGLVLEREDRFSGEVGGKLYDLLRTVNFLRKRAAEGGLS